jgi:transcriptional regulator with XRE-family HTH domain
LRDLPGGEILGPLQEEGRRMTGDYQEVTGRDGSVGGPEPSLKRGGLPLPALKYWRKRRGLSQAELARRAGLRSDYVFRVENGRRGCNPETARLLADLLEVELQALRRKPDDALDAEPLPEPAHPLVAYLHVHQDYLRIILKGAVGSAYAAMGELEVDKRCEGSAWEGVLEIVRARQREIGYLREAFGARGVLRDPDLTEDVRAFLESVLESFPDLDIRLLAEARRRETSEEGREALAKAMRDLL